MNPRFYSIDSKTSIMKHTLQQLEPRVLLAGDGKNGEEILTFIHSELKCEPGTAHPSPKSCVHEKLYSTYFTSGEVEICVGAECQSFLGTIKTTGNEPGVALEYEGDNGPNTLRYSMTIKVDGSASRCVFTKPLNCQHIQGRIDWPSGSGYHPAQHGSDL